MMFSFFNAYLLRPVPLVREPQRIVQLNRTDSSARRRGFSLGEYQSLRQQQTVFSDMVVFASPGPDSLLLGVPGNQARSAGSNGEEIRALAVSGNYFSALGVTVRQGRGLVEGDSERPDAPPVVVLSHGLWKRRFGSDPQVVGTQVLLNNHSFSVIGIAPPHFSNMGDLRVVDAWVPITSLAQLEETQSSQEATAAYRFSIMARIKPGLSFEQAGAGIQVVDARVRPASDNDSRLGLQVKTEPSFMSLKENLEIVAPVMTAVSFVLLLACANVANLFLSRAVGRQKEMGVRLALGATRWRVARLLLAESLVVATISGALGLLLGQWACQLVWTHIQQALPELNLFLADLDTSPDWRVICYTLLVSFFTGILFGLAPALQAAGASLSASMKEENTLFGFRLSHNRLRNAFAICQVAICFTLLIGSCLLLQSGRSASHVDFGFNPENVFVVQFNLHRQGYSPSRTALFQMQLLERARLLPGVASAGFAQHTLASREHVDHVSADYFDAMQIRLAKGRMFTSAEASSGVAVALVSESTALRLWPAQEPLGQRMTNAPFAEVIGVTRNARNLFECLFNNARPTPLIPGVKLNDYVFLPVSAELLENSSLKLVIRTTGDQKNFYSLLKQEISSIDPALIFSVQPLTHEIEVTLRLFSRLAAIANGIGAVALALSMLGIYSVVAFWISQRTREIGIRMALGAKPSNILISVLQNGSRLICYGFIIGIPGALIVSSFLSSILVGLKSVDLATYLFVAVLLCVVGLFACFWPARRASKILPMEALRHE